MIKIAASMPKIDRTKSLLQMYSMDNKTLFRILSLIPEENVESYWVEYFNRQETRQTNSPVYPSHSEKIQSSYELFTEYFHNHIEISYCRIYLKEGGSVEVDCLGFILWVKADISFPIFDKLNTLGFLGKDKAISSIRFT